MIAWLDSARWSIGQDGLVYVLLFTSGLLIFCLIGLMIYQRRLRSAFHEVSEAKKDQDRRLRNTERDIQALFEQPGIAVVLLDPQTHSTLYANTCALTLFGADNESVLEKHVLQNQSVWLPPPFDWQSFQKHLREAVRKDIPAVEWRFPTQTGQTLWLQCSITNVDYGGAQALMLCGSNITAQKQSEDSDRRKQQALSAVASNQPIEKVLELVIDMAEESMPEASCAILIVNEDQQTLLCIAGNGVPERLRTSLSGTPVQFGAGNPSTVAYTGSRLITENIALEDGDSHWHKLMERHGIRACWSEPIAGQGGETIGVFEVYHTSPWKPEESDLERITAPIFLASLAIERERNRKQLEYWIDTEREIRQISTSLLNADADGVSSEIDRTCASLGQFFTADEVFLARYDDTLEGWLISNEWEAQGDRPLHDFGRLITGIPNGVEGLFDLSPTIVFDQHRPAPEDLKPLIKQLNIETSGSLVLAGIYEEERLTGLLGLSRHVRWPEWSARKLGSVRLVANLIGSAFSREKLLNSLTHLAVHDRLTSLYNRHKLETFMDQEVARCERYNQTFSVILFDLDHFKSINDRFGHNEGDSVLRTIGEIMRSSIRESEIAGRWGGEEFVILLPETKLQSAALVADRIRQKVERNEFSIPEPVTISVGVASFVSGDTAHSLLQRADNALYRAKEHGRNCVQTSD